MNLNVLERIMALDALPQEGTYVTLKIVHDLRLLLSFTEKEIKEWNVRSDGESGITAWEVNGETEIPIGEKATDIIVDALKKLNRDQKLKAGAMSLYEKFIPTTE